jgi:hypothetical protein
VIITVNPLIEPPGLYISTYYFGKNCLTKMPLTSIFHFFWLYKASEGSSIEGFTAF